MTIYRGPIHRMVVICGSALLAVTGCSFQGVNSLPLPGGVGRGSSASVYHIKVSDVGSLEPNSPVTIDDVVVGSIGTVTVEDWHANLEVSVKPDVVVPANAVATIGQTSLLGSMHLQLDPPLGQSPEGRLQPGATIPLNKSSTYPSTEQTLSSLSAVVNGGGLGQIGDVIHNFNAALAGHEDEVRDLLTRLDDFVGLLDEQRDNIIASIKKLNRITSIFANQRDAITAALQRIPPALEVLVKERQQITNALAKLGTFSDTANRVVNDTQADLVRNLQNLEPALKALADVGPDLNTALAYATVYPFGENMIDRGVRGDYMNMYIVLDVTTARLKRTLLLGTRWGQPGAPLVSAPGDPWYLNYTMNPLGVGVTPPGSESAPAPAQPAQTATVAEPVVPVTPPPQMVVEAPSAGPSPSVFAGPYGAETAPKSNAVAPPASPLPTDGGGR